MEERAKEVKGAEESEKRAMNAVAWFHDVAVRTQDVRMQADLLESEQV